MEVTASAPAKIILFGEHFVVYGKPAIVMAINKRVYVKVKPRKDEKIYIRSVNLEVSGFFEKQEFKPETGGLEAKEKLEPIRSVVEKMFELSGEKLGVNIEIDSKIPIAAGLGSSAAVAASTAMALSSMFNLEVSRDDIFRIAYEAERLVHGTPSGIDPAIATYGGIIVFKRDEGFYPLKVDYRLPLVVGDTGLERSTGELVAKVRRNKENYSSIFNLIIEAGGKLVGRAREALKRGELEVLGELMNINHYLLSAIGVSHECLDRLVNVARMAGALGAKLTGAGGGGCMIALTPREILEHVASAIEQAGGMPFIAEKSTEGVKIESRG